MTQPDSKKRGDHAGFSNHGSRRPIRTTPSCTRAQREHLQIHPMRQHVANFKSILSFNGFGGAANAIAFKSAHKAQARLTHMSRWQTSRPNYRRGNPPGGDTNRTRVVLSLNDCGTHTQRVMTQPDSKKKKEITPDFRTTGVEDRYEQLLGRAQQTFCENKPMANRGGALAESVGEPHRIKCDFRPL